LPRGQSHINSPPLALALALARPRSILIQSEQKLTASCCRAILPPAIFMKALRLTFILGLLCLSTHSSRAATNTAPATPETAATPVSDKVWRLYSDVFKQNLRGQEAAEAVIQAMTNHPPLALIRLSPVQQPGRSAAGKMQGMRLAQGAVSMGAPLVLVLRYICELAPDFPQNRIVLPSSEAFTRYDYVDTLPQSGREVLRQALKKQFGLVARKEMRRNLVLKVKNPPDGLHKHSDADGGASARFKSQNVTMSELAKALTKNLGVKVTDQTGLEGGFDYTLDLTYPPSPDDLSKAVQDQLGLQLTPAEDGEEVQFLVVERVQ